MRKILLVVSATAMLSGCSSESNAEIKGTPDQMTMAPGDYQGYRLEACPDQDDSWLIVGTGASNLPSVRNEVFAPIYNGFSSLVSSSMGAACDGTVGDVTRVAISDWGDVDALIGQLGGALAERALADRVEVSVELPYVEQ